MADKNQTQATHITELSVGISDALENLRKLQNEFDNIREHIEGNPINITSAITGGSETTDSNSGGISGVNIAKNDIQGLTDKLKENKDVLKETEQQAYKTGKGIADLGSNVKTSGGFASDFLTKLADKAKWLLAYQFIMLIQNAFSQVISTIKGTEDSVIELQRVLNDSSLSNSAIADALYDIAYRYGQTFENVQETAVLFAQTGMDFNEVLQATEATMLGLNTAELEVTTATQGLIAVMSQFNLDASELNDVIDKINITADNFPVTSEKIVAALQRAGSAAHNYGLTLEETISIITALSEATGRAGANLGTALNSLINFSMKESSLKAFSDYLGGISLAGLDVLDVWTLLGNAIKDGGEELGKLMAESKEFSDLFSEEMAETIGALDEYNAALGNAEDVYSSAGVYRKNYFIALLNNINTVTEALQNMGEAEGYSVEENKNYMETLTSQWNQLVIVAQELAVQFGEDGGFLNVAKWTVQATTEILKLTKSFGGLATILPVVIALFTKINMLKVQRNIEEISQKVSTATGFWRTYKAALQAGATATEALIISSNALSFALNNLVPIIGTVIAIFSAISGKIAEAKQKAKEYREEMERLGKESKEQTETIYEAYKKFLDETSDNKYDMSAVYKLFEAIGFSENDANILIKRYGGVEKAITTLFDSINEANKTAAENALVVSRENLATAMTNSLKGLERELLKTEEGMKNLSEIQELFLSGGLSSYDEYIKKLKEIKTNLESTLTKDERKDNNLYKYVSDTINTLLPLVTQFELDSDSVELYGDTWKETSEKMDEAGIAAEKLAGNIDDIDLTDIQDEIKDLGHYFETTAEKVNNFRTSYSSLIDVIADYNQSGVMTAEMLETLLKLEPEYIELLNVKNSEITLNGNKLDELISKNDEYMEQLVAMKIAEEAETLAIQLHEVAIGNKTLAEVKSAATTSLLQSELYKVILGEIQGTNTTNELANAINDLGKSAELTGDTLNYLRTEVNNYVKSYSDLLGLMNKNDISTFYKKTGGSGTVDNPEKKALEAEVKEWKRQKDAIKDSYDTQINEIKKLKAEKEDYYDKEIDRLKEVEKQNDRINKQLDYYANRQKILTNLEQAQSRSGIEWRQKEIEYQQDLTDLDNNWRKTLAEWDIDDQIDELQRLKKEQSDFYDAQIDRLKEMQEAAVKAIEETITSLQNKISELSSKIFNAGATGFKVIRDEADKSTDKIITKSEEKVDNSAGKMYNSYKERFFDPIFDAVPVAFDEVTGGILGVVDTSSKEMGKTLKEQIKKAAVESRGIWKREFSDLIDKEIKLGFSSMTGIQKNIPILQSTLIRSGTAKSIENANVNVYVGSIDSPADADITASKVTDALNQILLK